MSTPTHSYVEDLGKAFLRSYILQLDTLSDLTAIAPTNAVALATITPAPTDDAAALRMLVTASEFLVHTRSLPGDADSDPDFAYLYNRMVREAAGRDAVMNVVRQFGEEYSLLTRTERMHWAQRALWVAEDTYSKMRKRLEDAQAACTDRSTKKTRGKLRDAKHNLEKAANRATMNGEHSVMATNDYILVLKHKVYWGTAEFPSEAGSSVSLAKKMASSVAEAGPM